MRAAITTHAMSLKRRLAGSCFWGMKCGTFTNGSAMRVFSSADACLLCSGAFCVAAVVARCGATEDAVEAVALTSANGSGAPQNGQKFSPRAGRPLPQVEQNATSLWGLGAVAAYRAGSDTVGDSLGSLLTSTVNSLTHCGQITTPPLAVSFATVSVCFFPQCGHLSSMLSERSLFVIQMQRYKNYLMWEDFRFIALVRSVFSFPFRPCGERLVRPFGWFPFRLCAAFLFHFCGMLLPTG